MPLRKGGVVVVQGVAGAQATCRVCFVLSKKEHQDLKVAAAVAGQTVSDVLRQAVVRYVTKIKSQQSFGKRTGIRRKKMHSSFDSPEESTSALQKIQTKVGDALDGEPNFESVLSLCLTLSQIAASERRAHSDQADDDESPLSFILKTVSSAYQEFTEKELLEGAREGSHGDRPLGRRAHPLLLADDL